MYVSLDWLKDFVDIPKNIDPKDLGNLLTLKTAEVEGVENQGKGLDGVVIGEVLEFHKHQDAKKLNIAKINIGKKEPITLIFGDMLKMKVGNKIPVAVAPTTLPSGIKIEKKSLRGIMSEGMLCLDQELGFKEDGVSIQYFPDLNPGTPLVTALKMDDYILEFDNKSLTNRPDLWGHVGMAREVAAITGSKLKIPKIKEKFPTSGESLGVEVKNHDLCHRYCGLIIENIKITDSPEWMQKRLKATGHGIHNNIVDVTNYVMAELGKPIHAFDKEYIKGGIIVRNATKGEKITTLDDKERELTEEMLLICDHKKPVALAGIIGGQNSEINNDTTSIILESASFDAANVRRTSTKLGVRTDAVQMFEKSLDPELARTAIERAAELIIQICPSAKIAGPITDVKKYDKSKLKIEMDLEKTRSKIGIDISNAEIEKILKGLEFKTKKKSDNKLMVEVPTFRATKDVKIEDDLIEEISRMYGYDNIPASLPQLPTKLPKENIERSKKHKIREILSLGLGLSEVYNYSFYGENELKNCLMAEDGHVKLINYLSEDQTHMRTTLIPNLLKNIQLNIKYFDQFNIYEIGRTYKEIGAYMPLEEKKISGTIVEKGKSKNTFYKAKGVVEKYLKKFNITKYKKVSEILNAPYAHPNKCITFMAKNGETFAQVFDIHPTVIKNHDLNGYSITMFEINFTETQKFEESIDKKYLKISKFPSIDIDISVVIDAKTEIGKIEKNIKSADTHLISNVTLFDIYQGENMEKGKKAAAFKITLQAPDRTLTDEEMTKIQKTVFKNLKAIGGEIRGA